MHLLSLCQQLMVVVASYKAQANVMFSSFLTRMHFCVYLSNSNLFLNVVSNQIHRKEKSGCQRLGEGAVGS